MSDNPAGPSGPSSDDDLSPEDRPTTARLPQRDTSTPAGAAPPVSPYGQPSAGQPAPQQPTGQQPSAPQYGQPAQPGAEQWSVQQNPQQSWQAPAASTPQQPSAPQYGQPTYPQQTGQQPGVPQYGQPTGQQPSTPQPSTPQPSAAQYGQQNDPNAATAQYGQQTGSQQPYAQPTGAQPTASYGQPAAQQPTPQYGQQQQAYATAPGSTGQQFAGGTGGTGGPAQPNTAYAGGGQPGQPAPKKSARKLIIGLVAGGGALVLLIVGGIVFFSIGAANHAPSVAVSAFLDKLKAGQAKSAVASLSPKPSGDLTLIDDAVYKKGGGQVTDYTISRTSGTSVTARVEYKNGTSSSETFSVKSTGKDLFWDKYAVTGDSLPTIRATSSAPAALTFSVNGKTLKAKDASKATTSFEFVALPGTYEFDYSGKGSDQFSWETGSVEVAGLSESTVDSSDLSAKLAVELSDSGKEAANKAIDAFVQTCFDQKVLAPTGGCGFKINGTPGITYSNIRWSVTTRPDPNFGAWDGKGFSVVSLFDGHYHVEADASNGSASGTSTGDVRSVSLLGQIVLQDDGSLKYESKQI
ncbi:hypothetical protein GCM10027515_05840 [Schumannella luteola]|uniref:DUF4878 domain-containing protein n=1 Tax=Schumannella luteola TaxID=472059 RepID=A0A852Y7G9_9MICO|nr:hypothetical protein [Schumannella luteola]NYG98283.1 hypothetical protein [Schumannella luteola]TPX05720.1 hypothetical protein FJ656_04605 [Schumannella luteola]